MSQDQASVYHLAIGTVSADILANACAECPVEIRIAKADREDILDIFLQIIAVFERVGIDPNHPVFVSSYYHNLIWHEQFISVVARTDGHFVYEMHGKQIRVYFYDLGRYEILIPTLPIKVIFENE